ncbi:HNH endonuclease signature motif containing protein [Burkholderia sp. D-99]|uniref:HNH endonuclease n=1 Tax=Burkholderia sp. D-99 TaxID=2717316 RepID=UPI0014245E22|nr:HNH endonuclease [Burkholderia sp. D-99]
MSDWDTKSDGTKLLNPNDNISRNTAWSFPGTGNEPLVACIWFDGLTITEQGAFYDGNDRAYRQQLLDRDKGEVRSDIRNRLRTWTRRSQELDFSIQAAFRVRQPIRLILVDGDQKNEAQADLASTVSARSLDAETWWVHSYDFSTGMYRIVQGVEPPERFEDESDTGIVDLGDDPTLQSFVENLDETERDAVIKARVGQGPYRDALFERWKGCSVTDVTMKEILVASHIKPWSQCKTAKERVSVSNGLLLVPTLDRLFDRGYITFDDTFTILISPLLSVAQRHHLGVNQNTRLRLRAFDDLKPFLAWHREYIFRS